MHVPVLHRSSDALYRVMDSPCMDYRRLTSSLKGYQEALLSYLSKTSMKWNDASTLQAHFQRWVQMTKAQQSGGWLWEQVECAH